MSPLARSLDSFTEADAHQRAGPPSRPRSKRRPAHADALTGFVRTVDRGRYTVVLPDREVRAMKARELGRSSIVVGDTVDIVGETSGAKDTLARVVRVHPREHELRRSSDDQNTNERVMVAGADQLVVVVAVTDPPPRLGLVDRCIAAAFDAGMASILCLTKTDLADPSPFAAHYRAMSLRIVETARTAETITGLETLREVLAGHVSVLVGHSGVGKSTLVNALIPEAHRATGVVNSVTGRGRHTSSSAVALELPGHRGWVIDTPGVRSFGLAHLRPERLLESFPDLDEVAQNCPRGCTHLADAPDCALDEWLEQTPDPTAAARVASFRRLLAARSLPDR